MMRRISQLKDLKIHATDGEIGCMEEFLFDDKAWAIRYLVVNTGGWLLGRSVLISPIFLRQADWETNQIHVALTKLQIENSPDVDTQKPVSRQHEQDYMNYFGSAYYWDGSYIWGDGHFPGDLAGASIPINAPALVSKLESASSHLRSTTAVKGYHIRATDGEIGHVEDFIVDSHTWSIRYLEVKTRNWLPGKKVLIAPEWIESVSWTESKVYVSLPLETIKSAPEYAESKTITREYENELHAHFGRAPYWLREAERTRVHQTA